MKVNDGVIVLAVHHELQDLQHVTCLARHMTRTPGDASLQLGNCTFKPH